MALRPSTQADFLNLWRQVLPASYTEPIESEAEGAGFDIPSLQAAIWADFESNLNVSQQAYFLRQHSIQTGATAAGGAKARTTLQLYRAAPALGAVLVPQGHVFLAVATDSFGGELPLGRYLAVSAVTIASGAGGPIAVEVEAEFEGYAGNVWEGVITRAEPQGRLSVPSLITATNEVRRSVTLQQQNADRFNLGMVGRMIRIVPDGVLNTPDATVPRIVTGAYEASGDVVLQFTPALLASDVLAPVTIEAEELADLGVTVTQPDPATGGRVDTLAAIAAERKTERQQNETDEQMADRLVDLPDTVSPGAVERLLKRVLDPYGIPWCLHETGEVDSLVGFTWDLHPYDVGELCGCDNTHPADSELVGEGIVWMSEGTWTRFFVVCVGQSAVVEWGAAYDSTKQFGDRPNAFDRFPWDGQDSAYNQVIARLAVELRKVKASGVGFAIALDSSL